MIHEDRQFDLVFVGDGSVGLQFIEVVITLGERVFSLILAIVLRTTVERWEERSLVML